MNTMVGQIMESRNLLDLVKILYHWNPEHMYTFGCILQTLKMNASYI